MPSAVQWGISQASARTGMGIVPRRPSMSDFDEKIRRAEGAGLVRFAPWFGNRTQETAEMRRAYPLMVANPVVKAALFSKLHSISSLDPQTVPVSDRPHDKRIADFVLYAYTRAISGGFRGLCEQILLPGWTFGGSVCEKVKREDLWDRGEWKGKRFYRALKAREKALPVVDEFGNITGIQGPDVDGQIVEWDPEEFLCYQHMPMFGGAGTSDLRAVYGPWWMLDMLQKLHAIHLDKFTSPYLMATYPSGTAKKILDDMEIELENTKSRMWGLFPEEVKFQAMHLAAGGEGGDFLQKCKDLEDKIVLGITGATLTMLTANGLGDIRGNSETQRQNSELFVWAGAAAICSLLDTQVTPWLVTHNFGEQFDFPSVTLGGVNYGEIKKFLEVAEIGQRIGCNLSKRAVFRTSSLQESADKADTLMPAQQPGFGGGGFPPFGGGAEMPGGAPLAPGAGALPAGAVADPVAGATEGGQVQALNASQIESLIAITDKVTSGLLTPAAARSLITAAFPLMPPASIDDIIRNLVPATMPPAAPTFAFAEPARAVERRLESQQAAPDADVGLGGPDGRKIEELLSRSLKEGADLLTRLTGEAVRRHLADGTLESTPTLFSEDETAELADQLAATTATAELLGRARIAQRAEEAERRGAGAGKFSDQPTTGLHKFDEPLQPLMPRQAWDFFKRLIPRLGTDPERFGDLMERQAFTLAVATDETLLTRVQDVVTRILETGQDVRGAKDEVDEILDQAGVGPRQAGYAENVLRTNLMDAYSTGGQRELTANAEMFPWWMMSNPSDGRSRPEHAARNGKYYPTSMTFQEVRGTDIADVAQCRCVQIPISKFEVQELQAAGTRVETGRFSEPNKFCKEGVNAGKPGPCPDPAKAAARAAILKRRAAAGKRPEPAETPSAKKAPAPKPVKPAQVKIQAAEEKVKVINAKVTAAKASLDGLKNELKAAKVDLTAAKASISKGVGEKAKANKAGAKENAKKVTALSDELTQQALDEFNSGGDLTNLPTAEQIKAKVREAVGKASPIEVAKNLGYPRPTSRADALRSIEADVLGRVSAKTKTSYRKTT